MRQVGTQFLASSMKEKEVNAYRERERQDANKILDGFLFLCHQAGVHIHCSLCFNILSLFIELDWVIGAGVNNIVKHHKYTMCDVIMLESISKLG